ncbi:hypothetical protein LTR27_006512 [Elasticomyces elasticus]|nr:hypothetical protein LTR27_006512 [Elasticomyces elasticus]
MPQTLDDPLQSPQESDSEQPIAVRKIRHGKSPLASVTSLPYRRSNASLSTLFASTTSLPLQQNSDSPAESGTVTPIAGPANGSIFSPGGSTVARSSSPAPSAQAVANSEIRDVIQRAFSPHVSILASQDTEELIRHKGINGGLLEILRPFGERVQGKVTIRDSTGVSRSWEDYGIRFTGVRDGLDSPRFADRKSTDSAGGSARNGQRTSMLEYKPARLRSGGDVPQVEELVERHLTFAEEQSGPVEADYITHKDAQSVDSRATSPFHTLYMRRLLSGLPMVPSETLSHPVASVIAISSRSANPIEELRNLFQSSNQGEHRLPQWVNNEFLRYYVLVHDEDFDDITKSMSLFDQMKRHFGLHCHLLRLRSTQCLPSDDGATKLPHCEWTAAAEELAEITRRETSEDDEDTTPCIFESDANAIRAFVREMVTQSIVPSMERASATWNDQVASRRRGLSGRFMSLSKRFTAFGGRNSSVPLAGAGSNYDSLQGFYRPDAPEAVMRKLADYGVMLRDYKLAQGTYEILCQDFKNDKAWRYYAGANEMMAVSSLLAASALNTRARVDGVDQYLETAYYSYITRVGAPYNALRTLMLGVELLRIRGGSALDDAARWSTRILDDRLVGPVGHVLTMERIAACYTERKGVGGLSSGDRMRKGGFWNMLATDAWLRLEKTSQAEKSVYEAARLYHFDEGVVGFAGMDGFLRALQQAVKANRNGPQHFDGADLLGDDDERTLVEPLQEESEQFVARSPAMGHRKSLSAAAQPSPLQTEFADPLGVLPSAYEGANGPSSAMMSPHGMDVPSSTPVVERKDPRDDGFSLTPTKTQYNPSRIKQEPRAMASRLDKLAPELLVAIASCVDECVEWMEDPEDDSTKQDLYALCLTSRALQAATTPFLYRRFVPTNSSGQFWQFAHTLTACPELAKYVQFLTVSACMTDAILLPKREELDRLATALSPLKPTPMYSELVRACEAGCSTAFAFAVVCLTTSLQRLAVVQNTHCDIGSWIQAHATGDSCQLCSNLDSWLAELFDPAWKSRYPNLKALTLAGKPRSPPELKPARLAIQMPGMGSVYCMGFSTGLAGETWQSVSATTNDDRALCIKRSWLGAADLVELVVACKELGRLEIEWDDPQPAITAMTGSNPQWWTYR